MIEIENLGNLGRYLKTARQMAGLSVETLAEKLGRDPALFKMCEDAGHPELTVSESSEILRACGLSVRLTIGKGLQ